MTLAWPPDPSTQLTIAFIVIALMALALILMFVHFHGGIKAVDAKAADLLHLHTNAVAPSVYVAPTTVDPAQLDAAIAKALDARLPPRAPTLAEMAAQSAPAAPISPWRQS